MTKSKKKVSTPNQNTKIEHYWGIIRQSSWTKWGFLVGLAFLIQESFLFSEFTKSSNFLDMFPAELWFPTWLNLLTALISATAIYIVLRRLSFTVKLVSVVLLNLLLVNYDDRLMGVISPLKSFMPILPASGRDGPVLSLVFMLLLLVLAVAIALRVPKLQQRYEQLDTKSITIGSLILVGIMFFSQATTVLRVIAPVNEQSHVSMETFPPPKQSERSDKPDIYYIVLDRYTNKTELKNQLGYDNTQFSNFLNEHGFTINESAYSNYPFTTMSIASTINADYLNDLVAPFKDETYHSRTLYHNLIRQARVVKALKQQGYSFHNIGSWYAATNKAPLADADYMYDHRITAFEKSKRLYGLEATSFLQSPYHQFFNVNSSRWPLKIEVRDQVANVREQLKVLDNLSTSKEHGGKFVMAHFIVPHDPFVFNGDGSISQHPDPDNVGKDVKAKYAGQVEFINQQMKQLIEQIDKQSGGNAVVILNADEGPYPQTMTSTFKNPQGSGSAGEEIVVSDMTSWSQDWMRMKYGILQAVRIPKASNEDLANLSSVNAFRIVLNTYFGYELPYLPDCHYGYKDTIKIFNFTDFTEKITNKKIENCPGV